MPIRNSVRMCLSAAMMMLSGCIYSSSPPSAPPPNADPTTIAQWRETIEAPAPVDPNVLKQPQFQALLTAVSNAGLANRVEEGLRPEVRIWGIKADGATFRVHGDPFVVYWFPTKIRANLGVTYFKQMIRNVMDLAPNIRFYQCDQIIVQYVGANKDVIGVLAAHCDAPFVVPENSGE